MALVQHPKLFSSQCRLVSCVHLIPIKFDSNSKIVSLRKKSGRASEWRRNIATFFVLLLSTQCIFKEKESPAEGVLAWIGLSMMLAGQAYIAEVTSKSSEIVLLSNSLFQFDSLHPATAKPGSVSMRNIMDLAIVYGTFISAVGIPIIFVQGLHWMNPCKASLSGYWMIPECTGISANPSLFYGVINFLLKFLVIIINQWIWSLSAHAGLFSVAVFNTMCVSSIRQFTQR